MSASKYLAPALEVFAHHPLAAILTFCSLHLLASTTGIPGSCTLLNTLSGAVFGFWRGCAIVYPITLLSALAMYLMGSHFRELAFAQKYSVALAKLRERSVTGDYAFFIGVRFSPILPFPALNALMGLLRIPLPFFVLTTAVGIVFDVAVLNALGAGIRL